MAYESELIKREELKVGEAYRKELLDFYAIDYNCMLIIPNSPANVYFSDSESKYMVKAIIDNCSVTTKENESTTMQSFYESIIIIEKSWL